MGVFSSPDRTGILLGAIAAFLIDKRLLPAAGYAAAAGVLSFFRFIHAGKVAWSAAPQIALGYLLLSAFFVLFGLVQRRNTA